MKRSACFSLFGVVVCLGAMVLLGCSKEKSDAPVAEDTAASDPAASASAATMLTQAEAALKAKEYDKAVQLIIDVQRQGAKLSGKQNAAATKLMQELQAAIGPAMATGDAKAKAAADILRKGASGR